ncbi:MAG: hypothetical protein EXQ48_04935 [Acidobacteria bacterium]|nr:hypothetical protein [Acidobacteriota bacterium]
MRAIVIALLVMVWTGARVGLTAQQTFSGVISDSTCGASHAAIAGPARMSDRECAFHCLKALAKFVLRDDAGKVIPIANQDFAGLPLRFARPVRLTGQMTEHGIVVSRIEPPLVHAHIGHVMTAWRDTPGTVGFLTAALSDARVAAAHALLTSKAPDNLADMKLHAGHVLHALEPTLEATGPASGYGTKKAAAGALQHVGFAAGVEGASLSVKGHATVVSAKLNDTMATIDRAIAAAQKVRATASVGEASAVSGELLALTTQIGDGLQQAQQEMRTMMKAEGL